MPKDFTNRPFDKLKKQPDRALSAAPPAPPSPPPAPPADGDLFAHAMSGVREIAGFRVLPCGGGTRREAPDRRKADADADAVAILGQIAEGSLPLNLSDTQEYVEWTNPDRPQGLAGDLHAGRFSVEGSLDLHGATGGEVNDALDAFLAEAARRGWRCVKIIHGRGLRSVNGPVLKDAVVRRLTGKHRKRVIAFVSARQCDGGLGALYVLLQK
jgi:DNA-nicking Smr family endonuclease